MRFLPARRPEFVDPETSPAAPGPRPHADVSHQVPPPLRSALRVSPPAPPQPPPPSLLAALRKRAGAGWKALVLLPRLGGCERSGRGAALAVAREAGRGGAGSEPDPDPVQCAGW